jgi:hypothetical protein
MHHLRLDGRALSHELLPLVLGVFLPRDRTHEMTLIPVIPATGYGVQPAPGIWPVCSVRQSEVVNNSVAGENSVGGRPASARSRSYRSDPQRGL